MKHRRLCISILSVLSLAACSIPADSLRRGAADEPIEFGAYVSEGKVVRTRVLDSVYIASDPFNMPFYIQLCADGGVTELGTYQVMSGYEGRLAPTDGKNKALMWHDLSSDHTFYAWNMCIQRGDNGDGAADADNNTTPTENEIKNGIPIKFLNSSEEDGYVENNNNVIYENFIGARSETVSYDKHGKYVDLTFHHLVSKINIASFVLIEPGGAIQRHLKADVTFVGMPTEAVFYPHPADGGRPRVEPKEPSMDNGVTYYIYNEPKTGKLESNVFYICPEADFSKIDFKVQLNNEEYKDYNTYYGTFDDVVFKRNPGDDYDNPKAEDGSYVDDSKILHAGEMMTLNITLIPGIGPGLAVTIDKWSTDNMRESQYHSQPGIYSDAEVKEIIDIFYNQTQYDEASIKDTLDRLFEMYGYTGEDGKKYFPLYEDVAYNSNIFPVWRDYIIDGMGHTITLKTNPNNTGYVQGPYFNVGPVRDVWLTDGTNTIYIDKEGYVWTFNKEANEYKRTENHLDELTGNEKSYDISCKDGKVHNSTYYNNSIVGS